MSERAEDGTGGRDVQMGMMHEGEKIRSRRQSVIDAAAGVFLRFGFARTTMGDLAQAAGISRPALYLLFCSKEAVFEAVVGHWTTVSLAKIADGLGQQVTLREKLRFACTMWCVDGLEMALANPHVQDMTRLPAVRASYARFEACLTVIIAETVGTAGEAAAEAASVIVSAMQGFKGRAGSVGEMHRLIDVLARLVADGIGAADRAATDAPQPPGPNGDGYGWD